MKCPRCHTELYPTNIRELDLRVNAHTCPDCHGFWIGPEQLEEIELTVEQRFIEFRHLPSKAEQLKLLYCPQCEGRVEMKKVESKRDRKVIMDVCPECHNIWLDHGEMEAIERDSLPALIADTIRWLRSRH